MAATSFSFINGSPNRDHKSGFLAFERPRRRKATREEGMSRHRITQTKIPRPPPKQDRKTQERWGLAMPFRSLKLDIMLFVIGLTSMCRGAWQPGVAQSSLRLVERDRVPSKPAMPL